MTTSINRKNTAAFTTKAKNTLLATTMLTATAFMVSTSPALADNAWVLQQAGGSFDTDTSVDTITNITQHSHKAIGVGNLDIKAYQKVNIQQDSSGDLFVARDNRADPTKILGALNANGRVMVIDTNGVFFGHDSVINVGSILVSTGDVSDADIMDGDDKFEFSNFGEGKIDLQGTITVADAGLAAFVSPFVSNSGVINARVGTVAMAAGDTVTLDLYGDGLVEIAVDGEVADALLENSGAINAQGGEVIITAEAAKEAVDDVINMNGVVNVGSISQKGGKIVLNGGGKGVVHAGGTLEASGEGGGDVDITGQNLIVDGIINADGGQDGDGGNVRVVGENAAIVTGRINARGGANSGDGGFVEVSGMNYLDFAMGNVDTTAANGETGDLLIDPLDVQIIGGILDGSDSNGTTTGLNDGVAGTIAFTGGTNDATTPFKIYESEIEGQSTTTNITIQARHNITTVAGGDNTVTLAANKNLTIETRNNTSGGEDNGVIDLSNLGFATQGSGAITITASTGNGTGNIVLGNLSAQTGNIKVSTDKGTVVVGGTGGAGVTGSTGKTGDVGGNGTTNSDGGTGGTGAAGGNGGNGGTGTNANVSTTTGSISITAAGGITLGGIGGTGGTGGAGGTGGQGGNGHDESGSSHDHIGGTGGIGGAGGTGGAGGAGGTGTLSSTSGNIFLVSDDINFTGVNGGAGANGAGGTGGKGGTSGDGETGNSGSGPSGSTGGNGGAGGNDGVDGGNGGKGGNGGTGGAAGAAGAGSINTGGTVSIERYTDGDISLGSATGGLNLTQAEIAKITAANLTIGGNHTSTIDVNAVNTTTATISNLVKLITGLNTGNDDDVNFVGTNVFNALEVHSNDDITFANNASVEVKTGNAKFTGDDNNATIGDFVMGTSSTLKTNGGDVDIDVLNLTMNNNSKITTTNDGIVGNGGNIHISTRNDFPGDGTVNILGGHIDADGGDIWIENDGVFYSQSKDSVTTNGNGTIDINQWAGGLIQNAVDAVQNTGTGLNTIHVGPGTFAENVNVYEDNFRLFGNNVGINPNTSPRNPETLIQDLTGADGTAYGFKVTSNNVTIDGFKVDVAGAGVWLEGGAGGKSGFDVKNNIIKTSLPADAIDPGVKGHNASNATIQKNLITPVDNHGIDFDGGNNVNINNNVISSTAAGFDGVHALNVGGLVIDTNTINSTGDDGIDVTGSAFAQIKNNKIGLTGGAGNIQGDGITLINSSNAQIKNNQVSNALGNGIFVDPSPFTVIQGNVINTVALDGIHLAFSDYSLIGGVNPGEENTINFAAGDSIEVDASDSVQVRNNKIGQTDGGSFGSGSGDGIKINNGSDYATVDGNLITTDGRGVSVLGGTNNTVSNNKITTISWVNSADEGIYAENTSNVNIHDNHITTADNAGIRVSGGSNATVNHNDIHAAVEQGIDIESVATANVTNNSVESTFGDGIFAYNTSGLTISGNWVGYSDTLGTVSLGTIGGDGIEVDESDGAQVSNNHVINTAGNGIYIDPTDNAVISGNTVNNAATSGIRIDGGDSNTITGNTVNNSGTSNILGSGGSNLSISSNTVTGAVNGIYVEDLAGGSITYNSVSGASANGITVSDSSNVTVGIQYQTGAVIPGNQGEGGNTVINSGQVGIEVAGGADNIVGNNTVNGAGSGGIYVHDTDNVDVDTNEVYSVTGKGIDVQDVTAHAFVYNNSVHDVTGDGIFANNVEDLEVTGNSVGGNVGGDGIDVENSAAALISGNTVKNVAGNGIYLDPSDGAIISGNTIDYFGLNGIWVDESDDVQVLNNNIGLVDGGFSSATGDAILVSHGSDGAKVDGNNVITDGRGVSLLGGDGHEVSNNTVTTVSFSNSFDEGIYAENTSDANIHDNHITSADNAGIRVSGGSNATVNHNDIHAAVEQGIDIESVITAAVTNNLVENTGLDGIYAYSTSGLTVSGNTVHNTGGDGVDVEQSSGAQITGNYIGYTDAGVTPGTSGNIAGDGVHLVDSPSAQINNNKITNVVGNGIWVDPSAGTTIDGNTINNAGLDGIHLLDSIDSFITNNTVNTTGGDGIEVENSDGTEVGGNTVDYAPSNGIYVNNSDNVHVHHNKVGQTDGGSFGSGSGDGILVANGSNDAFVDYNLITTDGRGVSLLGGDSHVVSNNKITTISWVNSNDEGVYGFETTNLLVDNNEIYSADNDGIQVDGGSNATVSNNKVDAATEHGIFINGVATASVHHNTVHNVGYDGIHADNTSSLSAYSNIVYNTGDDGIDAENSDSAQITGNYVGYTDAGITAGGANNIVDDGITLVDSDNGLISGNVITNVGGDGIFVDPSNHITIAYNGIYNAGANGINVTDGSDIQILSNTIRNAGNDGIHTWNIAYDGYFGRSVDVDGNSISGTGRDGIHVSKSPYARITDNTIFAVTGDWSNDGHDGANRDGIHAWNDYAVFIDGNSILGSDGNICEPGQDGAGRDGIHVVDSAHAVITNNEIRGGNYYYDGYSNFNPGGRGAGRDGIHVRDSYGSTVGEGHLDGYFNFIDNGNYVNNVGDDGIEVIDSDYTVVNYNDIYNTGDNGVKIDDSDYVDVIGNYISSSGSNGIYIDPSSFDEVADNEIYYSGQNGILVDGGLDHWVHNNDVYGSNIDGIHVQNFRNANISFNDVNETGDDGIEATNGATVWIEGNDVLNAGYWSNNADYYGADGIHVRNVNGPLYYGNYYSGGEEDNAGNGDGFGPFGGPEDYNVVIIDNNVGHLGLGQVDDGEESYYDYDISGAKDDGIEVVGDDWAYYDYSYGSFYGTGRTLIGWNNVSNVGYGEEGYGNYYGAPDGYGADGIHVRGVFANEGYHGYPEVVALDIISDEIVSSEDLYSWGPDGFGYSVEVLENTVTNTGDDGIEVLNSGKTLISGNEIDNTGVGFNDGNYIDEEYYQGYWGYNDGDGIHVANVNGSDGIDEGEDGYDYTNSVEVLNNDVTNTGDDGIEVNDSGRTLIGGNDVSNAGQNSEGTTPGDWDYGADGIHARDNYANDGYHGDGYYDVKIIDNVVSNSGDDGIEVNYVDNGRQEFKTLDIVDGPINQYVYADVINNNVTNSGDNGILLVAQGGRFGFPEVPEIESLLLEVSFDDCFTCGPYEQFLVSDVEGNNVSNSSTNGLYEQGPSHAYSYVSANTFTDNPVGANFESGLIDLTGPGNTFLGGDVGLFFNPYAYFDYCFGPSFADLELVDDDAPGHETFPSVDIPTNFGGTIGEQFFSGQSTYFVQLGNQAFWDFSANEATWLNGLNSTYDTPDGLVTPGDTGGFVSPEVFAFLEERFFHYPDTGNTGIFWFGQVKKDSLFDLSQEDIFRDFDPFHAGPGGLNITLLGLPGIPGGGGGNFSPGVLNAINTFAGGEQDGTLTPEELNAIETAAGGGGEGGTPPQKANCWGDAANQAYGGQTVNYSYVTETEDTVAGAAACSAPQL